ncbi:MAG: NUDIX domain-containing protein [Alphaproteobacteria bacterium]|nr:NUDIX domain-containing protein [Alphaproteobacteria bacterium]
MTECFDVLDEDGQKTGKIKPRAQVHRDGDWHKAVHIWIVNDKDEVLLQKRSPNKDSNPNMWDISSAGHLTAGDDSLTGAVREIKEELGVDILPSQLVLIGTKRSSSRPSATFINNEFNDVYLLRLSLDLKKIVLQEEEVAEVKYISLDEFRSKIKNRDESLLLHDDEFEMLFKALGYQL